MLNKDQAKAVADALLFSNKERQRERVAQREAQARKDRLRKRRAAFALAGMLLGAAIAYFADFRVTGGMVIGGLVGQLLNMYLASRRRE